MTKTTAVLLALVVSLAYGCGKITHREASPSTPQIRLPVSVRTDNAVDEDDSEPALFRALDETFGRKGDVKDGVYRLVTPRTDLFVTTDGWDVPTGAFLESDFRFWRCPCGKALVSGQFVVADYEANDVVEELLEHDLHVASMAPLMLDERPRLLLIRFQGEGRARELATALKSALSYTGEARNAPLPATLSPPHE